MVDQRLIADKFSEIYFRVFIKQSYFAQIKETVPEIEVEVPTQAEGSYHYSQEGFDILPIMFGNQHIDEEIHVQMTIPQLIEASEKGFGFTFSDNVDIIRGFELLQIYLEAIKPDLLQGDLVFCLYAMKALRFRAKFYKLFTWAVEKFPSLRKDYEEGDYTQLQKAMSLYTGVEKKGRIETLREPPFTENNLAKWCVHPETPPLGNYSIKDYNWLMSQKGEPEEESKDKGFKRLVL